MEYVFASFVTDIRKGWKSRPINHEIISTLLNSVAYVPYGYNVSKDTASLYMTRKRDIIDDVRSDASSKVKRDGIVDYFEQHVIPMLGDDKKKTKLQESMQAGLRKATNLTSDQIRPLLENGAETFIRYNAAISILKKVQALHEETMDNRVSSRLPFGIPSNFTDYSLTCNQYDSIKLYRSERNRNAAKEVYVAAKHVTKNMEWMEQLKVLVSKASPGGDEYPHAIISAPILAERHSVCTETYLIVDFVKTEEEGANLISYMKTKFFRFMMSLIKNTQNISKGVFAFVPVQDLSKPWTDEELYAKYGITDQEISFIDSMIRPMDLNGGDD